MHWRHLNLPGNFFPLLPPGNWKPTDKAGSVDKETNYREKAVRGCCFASGNSLKPKMNAESVALCTSRGRDQNEHYHSYLEHSSQTYKRYSEPDSKCKNCLATISTFSALQPAAKCNICSATDLVQLTHKNRNLKRCRQRACSKSKKGKAAAHPFSTVCSEKREGGPSWPIGHT